MTDQTPFVSAGFTPNDVFIVTDNELELYNTPEGSVVVLAEDDGSECPLFRNVHNGETVYILLNQLELIHTVPPAPTKYSMGAVFVDEEWGDHYMLVRINANQCNLIGIPGGNRWTDQMLPPDVTSEDIPKNLVHVPGASVRVEE